MKFLNLIDFGEGLSEATIVEFHVKEGDNVEKDDILVSVETAKAIVDIPSPQDGQIKKLLCDLNETINVGDSILEFEGEEDSGTVVGDLSLQKEKINQNLDFIIGSPDRSNSSKKSEQTIDINPNLTPLQVNMMKTMEESHKKVVPVTVFDDCDMTDFKGDYTVKIIQSVAQAALAVPILNSSFFDTNKVLKENNFVNLGVAVHSKHGLFTPVIKSVETLSAESIRESMDGFIEKIDNRTISIEDMSNPTIILSNFGSIGGKYATPIVVPPTVCIIGTGRLFESNGRKMLPISLTFDHRVIFGGDAALFMNKLLEALKD